MIALNDRVSRGDSTPAWHARFLALLPDIERHARYAFRKLDAEGQADAVEEVVANACCAYRRLVEREAEDVAYASALARFGVAQFWAGRRVGNRLNARDVCSRQSQQEHGFRVQNIGSPYEPCRSWKESLTDNTRSPVPDQAAFRIDFSAWLAMQSSRDRRVALALAVGERTGEVATRFGISPARVSQLRRELRASWDVFLGEAIANRDCRSSAERQPRGCRAP